MVKRFVSGGILLAWLVLLIVNSGGATILSARHLLHVGRGVNICSKDEDMPRIRGDCKSDPACVHESQCGCIPKGCNCGDERCIYTHEESETHNTKAVDLSVGGRSEPRAEEIVHIHDGHSHSHSGGDKPHHHTGEGNIVYDIDEEGVNHEQKHNNNHHHDHDEDDGAVDADETIQTVKKNRSVKSDTIDKGGGKPTPSEDEIKKHITEKMSKVVWIGIVTGTIFCIGMSVALRSWCRRQGRTMLSKDMFDDMKEMQAFDWDAKSQAAGWARDDL